MLNRAAILIKGKEPFVKWINETDPAGDPGFTIDEINTDRTIYLVDEDEGEQFEEWVDENYKQLFEEQLYEWYIDESLWPEKLTKELFYEWFEIECHTMVIDTSETELVDDDEA